MEDVNDILMKISANIASILARIDDFAERMEKVEQRQNKQEESYRKMERSFYKVIGALGLLWMLVVLFKEKIVAAILGGS